MSKGSGRRPQQVPNEVFEDNWNNMFNKPTVKELNNDKRNNNAIRGLQDKPRFIK